MDTKLKKSKLGLYILKALVFISVVVFFTGFINSTLKLLERQDGNLEIILENDFYRGDEFQGSLNSIERDLHFLISEYRNHEHILARGDEIKEDYKYRIKRGELFSQYMEKNPELEEEEANKNFEEYYKEELLAIEKTVKKEYIREMEAIIKGLNSKKGVFYYASNGIDVFTNTGENSEADFKKYKAYLIRDFSNVEIFPSSAHMPYWDFDTPFDLDDYKIYIGFSDDYLDTKLEEWESQRAYALRDIKPIPLYGLGTFISFVAMAYLTGLGDKKSFIIDRIYTDINMGLCLITIGLWFFMFALFYDRGYGSVLTSGINSITTIFLTGTFILAFIGLTLVLALIRHIKNRTFIRHSLIYTLILSIINFFRGIYNSSSAGKKTVFLMVAYPVLLLITVFIFPVTMGIAIAIALGKVRDFEAIKSGVRRIKSGDLDHKIEVSKSKELKTLAGDINDIGIGLKNAVDNELKSERHKSELITNVSHDIRTPLTSIITYVDLLKIEEDRDKIEEYIGVLDQKSQRLKKLIDDLFEASKVTSGNIPVNFGKIDIVALMEQALGELSEDIDLNSLDFISNYSSKEIYVRADGDLLWRAIENLLSNIFKYALKNSRVYVDILEIDNIVEFTIKNISAYELNITEDELMERFKRGDESRTSEGSGLGLSITSSLIEIQKGEFKIKIDGDLFKTVIRLEKFK